MGYMGGSYYKIPKAIFYLLKGDYKPINPKLLNSVKGLGCRFEALRLESP